MVFTNTLSTYTHNIYTHVFSKGSRYQHTKLRLRFGGAFQSHELPNFLPRIYCSLHELFPQHLVGTAKAIKSSRSMIFQYFSPCKWLQGTNIKGGAT